MVRYDIILYGATGFTGRQAVAYFQEHAPISVRWAIAGRNEEKLLALKQELNLFADALVADALNNEEIDILVQQTQVFLTTVGPYALYGNNIVANCAKYGVHYVDITGESPWVRDMLDQYGSLAQKTGAKIIPFCGFDSIPADLGVWFLQKYMRESWQSELVKADGYYTLAQVGLNGGTLLSALNMLQQKETKRLANPQLLIQDLKYHNFIPPTKRVWKNHYAEDIQGWVYPFFMADINTKVVYRSIGLAAEYELPHPKEFVYQEYHAIGKRIPALLASVGMLSFGVLGQFNWFRKAAQKLGPQSGEGPNQEAIENGFFKLRIIGNDNKGNRAIMTMNYQGDAGNKATTCFICECALALSLDHKQLPNYTGFLTPTIALGSILFERLIAADLQISCETI
ncbi:saccharopine dehydrogenase family protein [Aureispira anguillae]|uniref:Saccharopine dehydrogenase NADP-binding domain-containing protein n=1 Tax=Aureispira anguillae TaxID=2864201 RepID=A0A915YK62_9BACT|nr:saccharopine dehydrogenase NADP-binding domain-containing protein [Aureispira anguillae]BDS14728.1 saccharopine dehydrogenase NADP-binding domain-containing protein [Aureispira anguillae]